MDRIIVAVGGGENGRARGDGSRFPYETAAIDREIVRLTGKKAPHFLFLGHAIDSAAIEESYFHTMEAIYGGLLGCECRMLPRAVLFDDPRRAVSDVAWADIVYEGGGDTDTLMRAWRASGFDDVLRAAWEAGKVMCGISAGANCWCAACSSDCLRIQTGDDSAPLVSLECLGLIDAYCTPHCDEPGRLDLMREALRKRGGIGYGVSNCAALVFRGDDVRLITDDASHYGIDAYAVRASWQNGEYAEEKLAIG